MADRRGGVTGGGARVTKTRVKTAKGRKLSSTRWLQRQLNDPYVQRAKREGYRSRAAYKLLEIDEKRRLLKPGLRVLDLGAAPGGWTQVAVARGNALGAPGKARGVVLGVDLLEIDPIPGATLLRLDFLAADAEDVIREALRAEGFAEKEEERGGLVDLVLSDMAATTTGHKQTDHIRIIALCETAAHFAAQILSPGGGFVAKVLQGGTEGELLRLLKTRFSAVSHIKPPASRSDSAETYVVATGFRPHGKE